MFLKALSKALMDLRAEMVVKAEEDVKAHAEQAATQQNVQKLVDKRTKEIQVKIIRFKLNWNSNLAKQNCFITVW